MSSTTDSTSPNYFASMTDMMVGVLFIFILMVAYFALQISDDQDNVVPEVKYQQLERERDDLKGKLHAVTTERDGLVQQLAVLRQQLTRAQNTISYQARQIDALNRSIKEMNGVIDKHEKIIVTLKQRIAKLEIEIRDLKKPNPLEVYIEEGVKRRNLIVGDVVAQLRQANIDARPGYSQGVVTISGQGLFANGRSDLASIEGASGRVNRLSEILTEQLQCYVFGTFDDMSKYGSCNPKQLFMEAVFVEGHTDDIPIGRGVVLQDGSRNNLELSARRATNTYQRLVAHRPILTRFTNPGSLGDFASGGKQQVLSVAAYGEQRPIADNATEKGRQDNRRIDIRFVMYVPRDTDALASFRGQFSSASDASP